MATYLGIDIGSTSVRAVLLRTSYRRVALAAMGACELGEGVELAEALRFATEGMTKHCDGVAVALPGDQVFVRRLAIPATAARQMAEVVPFEIEAQLPFDMGEAVHDFRALPRAKGATSIDVFAAVARQADVKGRIDLLQAAIGLEPELVVPGAFSLAALVPQVPEMADATTLCLLDLGATKTELVVVVRGEVMFARTLSVGTRRLPESAPQMARELRQTLSAWRASGGGLIDAMYLGGGGSQIGGAEVFLSGELGIDVKLMPMPKLEGVSPEQASAMPRFARALGLALSFPSRGKLLDLRKGPLTYERGYGFLREKVPVLVGLAAVVVVSSLFSTWAEARALSREHEVLESALAKITKEVLGEETRDPSRVRELVDQGPGGKDDDPLPQVDAFDVVAQIAEALPPDLKHDIDELDVQRSGPTATPKVTIHGVVPKVQDAEDLATILKAYACFHDVKIVKTSQQVGGEGQKYLMEFDLKCLSPDAKKKAAAAGSAAPADSARGDK